MDHRIVGTRPTSRRLLRATAAVAAACAAVVAQLALATGSGAAAPDRVGPVHAQHRAVGDTGQHPIPMTTRYHAVMHGSITRIGNTLMTCDEKKAPLKKGVASCLDARKGVGQGIYNNNYMMKYINQYPGKFPLPPSEGGGFETLYSSSGAQLNLLPGSTVKYARLYWGGTRGLGKTILPLSQVDGVLFKTPDGKEYHEVNTDPSYKDLGYMTGVGEGDAMEHGYQASADVTDLVKSSGNGNYIVADMDSVVADHSWGGWSLVVAYENCDKPLRNIQLSDGFQIELPNAAPLNSKITGIKVPKTGQIAANLGFLAYDGDRTYTGDTVTVQSTHGPRTVLSTPDKPANDFMNSTISESIPSDQFVRTPNYVNQLGYDSDRIDISKLLRPGDTSLNFTFATQKDGYQVGAIFSWVNLEPGSSNT
ncbi:hypothetical protein [Streptacidiphilus cavernicola]|uniref:DUF3344 domain-containing protein n=1 Tax=Streptacidiphilus cavernicola TaxID=3342716 RepID=A0ABV6VXE5_9ACTN